MIYESNTWDERTAINTAIGQVVSVWRNLLSRPALESNWYPYDTRAMILAISSGFAILIKGLMPGNMLLSYSDMSWKSNLIIISLGAADHESSWVRYWESAHATWCLYSMCKAGEGLETSLTLAETSIVGELGRQWETHFMVTFDWRIYNSNIVRAPHRFTPIQSQQQCAW